MIKFICYPKCTPCQKAKKRLDDNKIEYELRDIKEENPSLNELTAWYKMSKLPLKKFFNTSGLLYKSMELMMFSYVPNDAAAFKYAFGLVTSTSERRQYIVNIPEFATVKDSVEIQQYLCGENVFKDLGEERIKRKIINLLWDDEPTHKQEFSDTWDKKYKRETDISIL